VPAAGHPTSKYQSKNTKTQQKHSTGKPQMFLMGPTLRVEPIGPGEELRCAAKRGPSIPVETDTPTHPRMSSDSMCEVLMRPLDG
jgi:hypothetical protein